MIRRYGDILGGAVLAAFAVFLYAASTQVKTLDVSRFGSGFFPGIVALLIGITGIVILFEGIRKAKVPDRDATGDSAAAAGAGAVEGGSGRSRNWAVLATFALMAAYAGLLPVLGFLVTTFVYLLLQMLVLAPPAKRSVGLFGIIALVTAVVVYFTFVRVFKLLLPAGILG